MKKILAFALMLLASHPTTTHAAVRQEIKGHIPQAVATWQLAPTGRLPSAQRLRLTFGLPLRNQAELSALLQQLYDPTSPNYRHYLTPEEFVRRFGPTEEDYQAVINYAKANGLTVVEEHSNRVVLVVEGPVSDVERVLHVQMRTYQHPVESRTFYAPDVEPSLDFGVPLLHISGLDNYTRHVSRMKRYPVNHTANVIPNVVSNGGSGPPYQGTNTYIGTDFRNAYVPGTTLTGSGQSVGLLQFDKYYAADIASYTNTAGIHSTTILTNVLVGPNFAIADGNGEVSLDIQMVMSMAPGLSKIYVYEASNDSAVVSWPQILSAMASNNVVKQFSCSWGETTAGSPDPTSESIFQQMAVQGQSFFSASGDSDAFSVGSVPFPSESTNITQVGATTLTTGSGATYTSEIVWNWGGGTGSSGGVSGNYNLPSYQTGISMTANLGSTTKRNVPDVALIGDNVYNVADNGASVGPVGGTSCAAPLWAGFTALVNQQATANGQGPVGFLNPAFYAIGKGASYSNCFHDITTGNNFRTGSTTRYPAVSGYDLCTGWGTPKGTNLINALAVPLASTPVIAAAGSTITSESCTATNGTIDPNETVTINFALTNSGNGNASNVVAILQATGGVTSPSASQSYGTILTGNVAVARSFTFTASGTCGGNLTATLQVQTNGVNFTTVTYPFTLGQVVTPLAQNFDGVSAPALPAGWVTSSSGAQSNWVTSTTLADTAPNAAFSADNSAVGVNELDSPSISIASTSAVLDFRQNYNLTASTTNTSIGYDGGVLEIKIGAGSYTDILAAGGSFVSGGYNVTLSSSYGNPLAGRQAWSGNSGGFTATVVNLPAAAAGQNVQLRWRCAAGNTPILPAAVPLVTVVTLAGWDTSTLSGFGPSPFAATTSASGITVGGLTRGSGVATSGTAAARAWGGTGWTDASSAAAIASNRFATFTIQANTGSTVSFSSISRFDYRRSGSGPSNGLLQYQVGGTDSFHDITPVSYSSTSSSGASLGTNDLSAISALQNVPAGTVVTFRIVNWGATTSGGTWYIYDKSASTAFDFEILGSVNSAGPGGWYVDSVSVNDPVCCSGATNSLPVINSAGITPVSPSTTNDLVAAVTSASDANNDPITFSYQWQQSTDGSIFGNIPYTTSSLTAAATIAGDYYHCIITPNDGTGNGPAYTTASVHVSVDFDGNGMNDDWEVGNFGHIGVDPNADPDGDGLSNLQEYLAGTDPNASASALRITAITQTSTNLLITWTTSSGKTNALERTVGNGSGGFATNGFTTIFTINPTTSAVTNYLDIGAATQSPSYYYRVRLIP